MKRFLLLLMLGLPTPALAGGWMVDELPTQPDRLTCMTRAENTFHAFRSQHGGGKVVRSPGRDDWTVAAEDLGGKSVEGLIICPIESQKVEPFLILLSMGGDPQAPTQIAPQLRTIWSGIR